MNLQIKREELKLGMGQTIRLKSFKELERVQLAGSAILVQRDFLQSVAKVAKPEDYQGFVQQEKEVVQSVINAGLNGSVADLNWVKESYVKSRKEFLQRYS